MQAYMGIEVLFVLLSLVTPIGIILLIALLIRGSSSRRPPPPPPPAPPSRRPALDVLEERYARGEITQAEFAERRSVLLGEAAPPHA